MEIGKRIKKRREAMGLTREQLAKAAGCHPSLISRFETGHIPKKTGGGVMARVKRVLKVRIKGSKPAKRPKATRKAKAPDSTPVLLGKLLEAIGGLAVSVASLAAKFETRLEGPPHAEGGLDLSLVPPVAEQREQVREFTERLKRRPLGGLDR